MDNQFKTDLETAIADTIAMESDGIPESATRFFETYYSDPETTKQQYDADVAERIGTVAGYCQVLCGATLVWCRRLNGGTFGGHAMCQAQYHACVNDCTS